jgi:hypothetical protein
VSNPIADALRDAVGGDTDAIEQVRTVAHERMAEVAGSLPPLVLRRVALTRVLSDLRDGVISTEQAQRWASFVRRGYLPRADATAVRPIDIAYEDEAATVDPLARLDELGDVIDGTMPADELNDWIARLSI